MGMFISNSPEETVALGETWGREAVPRLVIGLSGELGSGKTQLVKGIARGLGITRRVTSPSFTLVNEYRGGRLPLFHLDLYRLDTPEQIIAAGLEDYLYAPAGVAVVEWIEHWAQGSTDGFGTPASSIVTPDGAAPSLRLSPAVGRKGFPECGTGEQTSGPLPRPHDVGCRYRGVRIEALGELTRQICYEDSGS